MPQSGVEAAPRVAPARILVVEDEPLTRFAMAEALRDLGVSVVEAASADEAWQYLMAGGSVDLVFTDHWMSGSMTGAQLAARRGGNTRPSSSSSLPVISINWNGPNLS